MPFINRSLNRVTLAGRNSSGREGLSSAVRAVKTPKNAINGLPTHGAAAAEEETAVAASCKSEQPRLFRDKYRKAILNANPRGSVLIECDDFFPSAKMGPQLCSVFLNQICRRCLRICVSSHEKQSLLSLRSKKKQLASGDHFFPSDSVAQRCLNTGRTSGRQQRQHHWPPDHSHKRPIHWGDDRRHCASQPILRGTEILCTGFRWFPAPLGTTPTTFRTHGKNSMLNNRMICDFHQPNRLSWCTTVNNGRPHSDHLRALSLSHRPQ